MKIQYKAASIMTLFGVVIVILLSGGYDVLSHKLVIEKEMKNIKNLSEEVALHVESHLKEKTKIAMTISSAPLIKDALLKSNSEFAEFAGEKRKQEIDSRNRQWMKTADISDPFIQAHMANPVAEYLKSQQIILPGEYGEIFLTNRFGVMIATTGKLTTLAHSHKYWWLASYGDGQGRIFLDDRGFDTSVGGYVLGVVIPIRDGNEIIGILKCNVNIIGSLTDVVQEFALRHSGRMKIVRTGGLILSEHSIAPLSTQVNDHIVKALWKKETGTTIIAGNNEDQLVAFSPVQITMGSEKFGFGGSKESIDHIKGNKGEGWHIVISLSEEKAIGTAHEATLTIIIVGIIFTLLTAIVASLLGKWAARPIVELATTAQTIGEGRLDTRANLISNDEIGSLAKSLNRMAKNLQDTMTSRDELIHEVEQRKKVEEKLHLLSTTDELTGAYNRRAFNDYLHTNIGRAKRYNEPLSMLLLDVDHFKNINDSHGHDVGDLVLKSLVCVIKESIRQEDTMARWGGEEFTILLPQTGKDAALQQAERLREKIFMHNFPKIDHLTVSIGHTELQDNDTSDSFVKRADDALFQAKEGGKNIVISC
ncbi:MAG: diguanylate cyclase [Desulfobacula sp.]|uniref:sensor domain-containing diguanylate cyclase n=1 Tax=Desulfobacula sp. TaxID=2593537 RepID=UPI001DE14303|nr:diguanylate cyclase [Desulfobacula sp.]MBT4090980.1 diguanylate cyclase [Deltaproteobacteria bacterium]MBT4508261.1 diguanylate cyclase [Desulfobacula sp.]MBT7261037.1 diguanylate cyclase [Desulfobacula sp.]